MIAESHVPVPALIGRFVDKVNRSPHRRLREDDLPECLRVGRPQFGPYYDWKIRRSNRINWVSALESKLPAALPPSYKSFVGHYLFPSFEADSITLLSNTGENLYHEMQVAIFRDAAVAQALFKNGFVQFARPASGYYDPVCFDTKRCVRAGEYPVVRIDYGEILRHSMTHIVELVAPSFQDLVEKFLQTEKNPLRH